MAATMKDIAKHAGLGLATVSKYLNGGNVLPRNKEAIDKAIRELDFTVNEFARSLKTSHSHTIGVIIPELSNLFITTIITHMEDKLRSRGYAVIVCDCRSDEKREEEAVRFLLGKMVDGIINMPATPSGKHLLPALDRGVPVVLIDRKINNYAGKVSAVLIDNATAAKDATARLLQAGHRNIGLLVGPEAVYTTKLRLRGYDEALAEFNLAVNRAAVRHCDYTMSGAYKAMLDILSMDDRPTAVLATNYEMTLGALMACNELHLQIPDDLSFIGFDKQDLLQAVYPDLTAVHQPLEEIGFQAAMEMLSRIAGEETAAPKTIILCATLDEGSSVKKVAR